MENESVEQQARDMLARLGIEDAQSFSTGDLVELANVLEENARLRAMLAYISTSDSGGEIFPVGPADVEWAEDGNTVVRYVPPWRFMHGTGDTFLAAVEDAMRKDSLI